MSLVYHTLRHLCATINSMIDIQLLRDTPDLIEKKAADKGYTIDAKAILALDDSRRKMQGEIDELRQKRNDISAQMKGGRPAPELIEEGKRLKTDIAEKEAAFK